MGLAYPDARHYARQAGGVTSDDPVGVNPLWLVNPQRMNRYAYGLKSTIRMVASAGAEGRDVVLHPRYRLQVKRSIVMTKSFSAVTVIGIVYVVAIAVLYVRGAGIAAAYLTMPAWFLVGAIAVLLTLVAPDSVLDATLFLWAGNLVALLVSATLNVGGVYFVLHRLSRS